MVEALDLSALIQAYAGRGSLPDHPAMMRSLLIYGYATGCYSSRKIELATFDSVAFCFIACNQHPDHDTLATFRKRFRVEFEALFVQVLEVAHAHPFSRFGQVSLDGTKIHANASRHSALSDGHAETIEAQLKGEVQALPTLAEQTDKRNLPEGMSLPEELQLREVRLAAIAEAKREIEARAAERFAREQAAYEAKLAARAAKAAARGRKPGGRAPKAPSPAPRAEDQINLTDAESRIMHLAGGGFEQCYNAQAVVDTASMLVTVAQVTQAGNDKEQVGPLIEGVQALPEGLNHPEDVIANNGYFSARNVAICEAAGSMPLIAMKRDEHHPHWSARFSEPAAVPPEATPVERMAHRLKTVPGGPPMRCASRPSSRSLGSSNP